MSILKKQWARWILYIILFSCVGWLIYYYGNEIINNFHQVKWWLILAVTILQIPMIALGGFAFDILCKKFNIYLAWQDWMGLSFIANFLNQLLPYRPGMGFRFLYLHKHYSMKADIFATIMLIYFLLMIISSAIFTLIGWILSDLPHRFDHVPLISIFLIIIISLSMFIMLSIKTKTEHIFKRALNAIQILINSPMIMLKSFFVITMMNLITTFIFYVIFIAFQSAIPPGECLFLVGVITLAMIVPITPANIGVLESIAGTLTQMIYHDFSIGFSVTALFRASQWLPSCIFALTFSFILGTMSSIRK